MHTIQPSRFTAAILLIVALITRFAGIDSDSLWLDEGLSVRLASLPFAQIITTAPSIDHNPPLYLYLLHFWITLWGDSETAVRSLSAILNIFSAALLWHLGKTLFSRPVAVTALLFFLLSPFQIYYAQEARAYSLLQLTALASLASLLQILRTPGKMGWVRYFASTLLLLYSHIYAWFFLLFENLYLASRYAKTAKPLPISLPGWVLMQLALVILYLPYGTILWQLVIQAQAAYWIATPSLAHLGITFAYFSGSPAAGVLCLVILAAGLLTRLPGLRKDPLGRRHLLLLSLWLGTSTVVPFALSLLLSPFYLIRYPIAAAPAWYLLVAVALQRIRRPPLQVLWGGLLTAILIYSAGNYYLLPTREPWREALREIAAEFSGDDILLAGAGFCIDEMFGYYGTELSGRARPLSRQTLQSDLQAGLEGLHSREQSIWFVSSHFAQHEAAALEGLAKAGVAAAEPWRCYQYRDLLGRDIVAITIYRLQLQQ